MQSSQDYSGFPCLCAGKRSNSAQKDGYFHTEVIISGFRYLLVRAVNSMRVKGGCHGLICSEMGYTPTVA
jgi:hypothetical protein